MAPLMLRRLLTVRVLVPLTVVIVVLVAGWFWYRSSSLVKIQHVTIVGVSGPDVPQIKSALEQEALTMTTLNLSVSQLEKSVSNYPVVSSVSATTHGSHAVTINVVERIPVAMITHQVVDGGGYVLAHNTAKEPLPTLKPVGDAGVDPITAGQVTGAKNLAVLKVLGGAPYRFLARVKSATYTSANGIVLQIRNGPVLQFGGDGRAAEKWEAVLAVLANASSSGACEINVVDPQRPAAGTSNCSAGGSGSSSSSSSAGSNPPASTTGGATAGTTTGSVTTNPSTTATTPTSPTTT
jgi:cell division septal protein FtsQ